MEHKEPDKQVPAIEELIEKRVTQARKEEVLTIYQDLLQTIWDRILPTLGRVTVVVIIERALTITQKKYPILRHFQVVQEGIEFQEMHRRVDEVGHDVLREALNELIVNLIDILAMLTGNILVEQLVKEIEGKMP